MSTIESTAATANEKAYRIGTDDMPGGKVRARTRGPIRTSTATVAASGDFLARHETAARYLARKHAGPDASVVLVSNDGFSRCDWAVWA